MAANGWMIATEVNKELREMHKKITGYIHALGYAPGSDDFDFTRWSKLNNDMNQVASGVYRLQTQLDDIIKDLEMRGINEASGSVEQRRERDRLTNEFSLPTPVSEV